MKTLRYMQTISWLVGIGFSLVILILASHGAAAQTNTFPSSGNAGIGTTSPNRKLEVIDTSNPQLRLTHTAGSVYTDFQVISTGNLVISPSGADVSITKPISVAATSDAFRFYYSSEDIKRWGIGTDAGGLFRIFQRGDSWADEGTRLTINRVGNLGIGTTSPTEKLEVSGTVKSSGLTVTGAPAEPPYVNALYLGMNGTTATIDAVDQMVDFRDLVISNKTFQVKSWNGGGLVTGLFQNNAGNVGIGLTDPTYKLHVNGSFNATSINLNGSPITSSQWLTSGTNINYSAGNVGVGTTSPAVKLHVVGGTRVDGTNGRLYLGTGAVTGARGLEIIEENATTFSIRHHDPNVAWQNIALNPYGGNVGIGTTTPTAKLDVNGNTNINGNINVTGTGNITAAGTIEGGNIKAKYQDVAEWVESSQELPTGTLVVLDHTKSNQVIASSQAYDTRVAGVISERPGIALGEGGDNRILVATTGRVRLMVDASNGPIQIGDLLVTSDIPGAAMKSQPINVGGVQIHRPGTLVGKALEPLAKGQGKILVLLSLQ